MFCLLHSSISIEQHKSTSAIHLAIMENMEDSLVMRARHISMHENSNALISELIIALTSVSAIFVSFTEAIMR